MTGGNTMLDSGSSDDLLNATAYDTDDNKIGRVGRVYLDDQSGEPEWVTVQTGLFGTNESFLPLGQARLDGERLIVPIAKDAVQNAPHIDADSGHLSVEEEQRLYQHYGLSHGAETADPAAETRSPMGEDSDETAAAGSPDSSDQQTAMPPSGMRLRRHLVTEEQQITVPVVREEYILEDDAGASGDAADEPGVERSPHDGPGR